MVPNVLRGSVENEEIGQSTIGTTKGTFSAGLPYGIFKVLLAIWLSSYDLASFFKILPQCVWLMMVLGQTKEHIKVSFFLLFLCVKVGTCQSCSYFNQTKKSSELYLSLENQCFSSDTSWSKGF